MMNSQLKGWLRRCLIFICTIALVISSVSVYATDSVDSLEDTTSELKDELSDLNEELTTLTKDMDQIVDQIETTTREVEQTKIDLANAKAREDAQYEAMKSRIKYMYEAGETTLLQMLFAAEDMADFLNKAEFITNISQYDRNMLNELQETQQQIAAKEEALAAEQDSLNALRDDLSNKQNTLNAKISNTSGELDKYSALLEDARAAEKAAQEALEEKVPDTNTAVPSQPEAPSKPPSNQPAPPTNQTPSVPQEIGELELMAAILQCEAGSTNYEGLLAVGSCIINRVRSPRYPNTIRGVIYQSGQFSPVWTGKLDRVLQQGAAPLCYTAAADAIAGKNNIGDCLQFRSAASSSHEGIVIGGNVFF